MIRYNIIDGVMVEAPDGVYMKVEEHNSVISNIRAQLAALRAYNEAFTNYMDTL